jgi:hypothetical protein
MHQLPTAEAAGGQWTNVDSLSACEAFGLCLLQLGGSWVQTWPAPWQLLGCLPRHQVSSRSCASCPPRRICPLPISDPALRLPFLPPPFYWMQLVL